MDYWVIYGFLVSYYVLGLIYLFFISKNKSEHQKYKDYKKNDPRDDLTHELLMEAEL